MAKQKTKKGKSAHKSRVITRILGATLMLFILLVLLFVGLKFITADDNMHLLSSEKSNVNGRQESLTNQSSQQSQDTSPQDTSNKAKYSFYDELKQRSSEVEAEINEKIAESERQQKTIEGDNYRIQVGAFRDKDKADRLRARIILRDYPVMILRSNSMYLVQVGPYKQREDALTVQKRLEREGISTLLKNYVAK